MSVLTVVKEPDYWSGGHFHEGTKSYISPFEIYKLPIGTKLYTHSKLSKEEINRIWLESAYVVDNVRVDPQDRLYLFVDRLIERMTCNGKLHC